MTDTIYRISQITLVRQKERVLMNIYYMGVWVVKIYEWMGISSPFSHIFGEKDIVYVGIEHCDSNIFCWISPFPFILICLRS